MASTAIHDEQCSCSDAWCDCRGLAPVSGPDMTAPRRTSVVTGHRAGITFAEEVGLRVISVVSGVVRATRQPPFGISSVVLSRGEVLCAPGDAAAGFLESLTDEPAIVVDTVVPIGGRAGAGRTQPPRDVAPLGAGPLSGDERLRQMCMVTTAVLDALTAPNRFERDDLYERYAGRYLTAHLTELLAHGTVAPGVGRWEADVVEPQLAARQAAGQQRDGARAFSPQQQEALLAAMHARLAERVRIHELAALVGYSKYHFLRRFQTTFDQTPYQYLTELRITVARQWLDAPDVRSLGWIAKQCGFSRTESFVRAFRQRVGVTPARYAAGDRPATPAAARGEFKADDDTPAPSTG